MYKYCILLSGPTISCDYDLVDGFKKYGHVIINPNNHLVEKIISIKRIDVLILEHHIELSVEMAIVQKLKSRKPGLPIFLVDTRANRSIITAAFLYGVTDAFIKPYKVNLMIERINALMLSDRNHIC